MRSACSRARGRGRFASLVPHCRAPGAEVEGTHRLPRNCGWCAPARSCAHSASFRRLSSSGAGPRARVCAVATLAQSNRQYAAPKMKTTISIPGCLRPPRTPIPFTVSGACGLNIRTRRRPWPAPRCFAKSQAQRTRPHDAHMCRGVVMMRSPAHFVRRSRRVPAIRERLRSDSSSPGSEVRKSRFCRAHRCLELILRVTGMGIGTCSPSEYSISRCLRHKIASARTILAYASLLAAWRVLERATRLREDLVSSAKAHCVHVHTIPCTDQLQWILLCLIRVV